MELERAKAVAANEEHRTGKRHIVFRMPAWPDGVWGTREEDLPLPSNAEVVELERQKGLF